MSTRHYERTVGAGETSIIDHAGDSVICLEANLSSFQLSVDGGPRTLFTRGLEWRPRLAFGRVHIHNTASVALTVTLVISQGEFIDRRLITAPNTIRPETIDQIRGKAYRQDAGAGATAAEYSFIQIWNPAASGKIVVVRDFWASSDTATNIKFNHHNVQLGVKNQDAQPVYNGDAEGVSDIYAGSNVVPVLGTEGLGSFRVSANAPEHEILEAPVILPAGAGFFIENRTVNATLNVMAEVLEVDG